MAQERRYKENSGMEYSRESVRKRKKNEKE